MRSHHDDCFCDRQWGKKVLQEEDKKLSGENFHEKESCWFNQIQSFSGIWGQWSLCDRYLIVWHVYNWVEIHKSWFMVVRNYFDLAQCVTIWWSDRITETKQLLRIHFNSTHWRPENLVYQLLIWLFFSTPNNICQI